MTKNNKKKKYYKRLIEQIKTHKKTFIIYIILRVLVIITLILQLFNKNYENVFLCVLTLLLFLIPSIMEMRLHITLPDTLEIIILLFIFSAEILGEIQNFYNIFTHWDTILHTLNGFLCAAIGFSVIDILNRSKRFHLNLKPIFVALFGFCFSMTIGVLWEFCEYGCDKLTTSDTQKDEIVNKINTVLLNEEKKNKSVVIEGINKTVIYSESGEYVIEDGYLDIGLNDTMEDLFVNFIGAVIFCSIGYFYVKRRKENSFVEGFIMEFNGK